MLRFVQEVELPSYEPIQSVQDTGQTAESNLMTNHMQQRLSQLSMINDCGQTLDKSLTYQQFAVRYVSQMNLQMMLQI